MVYNHGDVTPLMEEIVRTLLKYGGEGGGGGPVVYTHCV